MIDKFLVEDSLGNDSKLCQLLEELGISFWVNIDENGRILTNSPEFFTHVLGVPKSPQNQVLFDYVSSEQKKSISELMKTCMTQEQASCSAIEFTGKSAIWHLIAIQQRSAIQILAVKKQELNSPPIQGELQTHKLVTLGSLAAGVAHDLNNIFTSVFAYTGLLKSEIEDPNQMKHVNIIDDTIQRACSLTSNILSFLRADSPVGVALDPIKPIRDTIHLSKRSLGSRIKVQLSLPTDSYPILLSRSDLHQILLNLLTNARDAMGGEGTIFVRACYLPPHSPKEFQLEVEDTGRGLSLADPEKIFDAFYTTKENEEGTGLGLTIVKKLIERAGGSVNLSPGKEGNTCFKINLPTAQKGDPEKN